MSVLLVSVICGPNTGPADCDGKPIVFFSILFYFSSVNMETTYKCTETIVRISILAPCPVRVWRQKNKKGRKKLGIFNMPQTGKGGLYFMVSSGLAQQPS